MDYILYIMNSKYNRIYLNKYVILTVCYIFIIHEQKLYFIIMIFLKYKM